MPPRTLLFLVLAGAAAAVPAVASNAYGHGLGSDIAPPISFKGMEVTVRTALDPIDITVGEINSANMQVRFYDNATNSTLDKVTYRIDILRGEDLLARNNFFDYDGILDVEIRPVHDCAEPKLSKCSSYYGTEHPLAAQALYAQGQSRPLITGPIFLEGGLYNIKVAVTAATSARTLINEPLEYDTFVSVAQKQPFFIQTANADVPVAIKTYYDEVSNFSYDPSDDSVKFEMPFDWSPDYIEYVALVHEEFQVPKSFAPYNVTQFKGYVDGVEVSRAALSFDPYSSTTTNTIHFLVTGDELRRINDVLGDDHQQSRTMSFEIIPREQAARNSVDFFLTDAETSEKAASAINISWDGAHTAGDDIPFEIDFLDENRTLLKDVMYAYYLVDPNGDVILEMGAGTDPSNTGIWSPEGTDYQTITLPSAGIYQLDIRILGTGAEYDPTYAGAGSVEIEAGPAGVRARALQPGQDPAPGAAATIPSWVSTSAGFWVDGAVSDGEFVSAIEYLINNGIIAIPPNTDQGTSPAGGIPSWIKTSVGYWVDGSTSDDEFITALQFLIKEGIITVG